jgi:methylenetetrahydrofolate reductase (NADPH)
MPGSLMKNLFRNQGGHDNALDLVKQIDGLNHGIYQDSNIENGSPMDFCIGVAGYPEKHFEAPSLKSDMRFTKKKIEAGADYIVTQMFFDNAKFFNYAEQCKKEGIDVPIVPGIKPLTKKYQLNSIPRNFYIDLPYELVRAIQKAKTDEAVIEVGIEWCVEQSRELKKAGVPCIHYYTMGDSDVVRRIVSQIQ